MSLRDDILAIIRTEPGIDTMAISDQLEARRAKAPPGRAARFAAWLFGADSFLAAFLSQHGPSIGAVHATLDALEEAGLVRSVRGSRAVAERGHRPRLYFYPVRQR